MKKVVLFLVFVFFFFFKYYLNILFIFSFLFLQTEAHLLRDMRVAPSIHKANETYEIWHKSLQHLWNSAHLGSHETLKTPTLGWDPSSSLSLVTYFRQELKESKVHCKESVACPLWCVAEGWGRLIFMQEQGDISPWLSTPPHERHIRMQMSLRIYYTLWK